MKRVSGAAVSRKTLKTDDGTRDYQYGRVEKKSDSHGKVSKTNAS